MRDQDAGSPHRSYVTWVAAKQSDFASKSYSSGTPTPVGAMVPDSAVVIATWT